jgi:hypothetical protein
MLAVGADVGMAGEHLRKLQVPGAAQELGDRRGAGLVHRPMGKLGAFEALRPPAMHGRGGKLLLAVFQIVPTGPP